MLEVSVLWEKPFFVAVLELSFYISFVVLLAGLPPYVMQSLPVEFRPLDRLILMPTLVSEN